MHSLMKLFFVFSIFTVGIFSVVAQSPEPINHTASDSQKLVLLFELADEFSYSEPDSSLWYAKQARNLARRMNQRTQLAEALQRLGDAYRMKGDYDSALSSKFEVCFCTKS